MPLIFPVKISEKIENFKTMLSASRHFTLLEIVMVLFIIALMSVAAVGVLAPEPEADTAGFCRKFMDFALSARRQAVTEKMGKEIFWERENNLFRCGSDTLELPANISLLFPENTAENSNNIPETDTVIITYITPDGGFSAVKIVTVSDGISSAVLKNSPLSRLLYFAEDTESEQPGVVVITEGNSGSTNTTPLWTDEAR